MSELLEITIFKQGKFEYIPTRISCSIHLYKQFQMANTQIFPLSQFPSSLTLNKAHNSGNNEATCFMLM